MSDAPEEVVNPRFHREILSFTRRGGRLTDKQQGAWDELSEQFVLTIPRHISSTSVDPVYKVDFAEIFGREAANIMEIGSGRGEALIHAARENPDKNFLGLEVYIPGVAQTLISIRQHQINNIRLAVVDAAAALTTMLPEASLEELRIWFPDPWHKKRHHKRRLITPEFVPLAARVVQAGGVWRMATDWQEYAEQMFDVFAGAESFDFSGTWDPRFEGRPVTRFETKGLRAGRKIYDLSARRLAP